MGEAVFFRNLTTKGLTAINSGERYFEGWLTVQVKDKQGEVTIVDELMKVLPVWIDRGAPISDTHSNRIIGKGINYSKAVYKDVDGTEYPAIKVTGKIHKNYELDNDIWGKIKSGEYKGLSFGGATKSDREPMQMKDGSIAYSLKDLEHYEVAVCRDPAVPLALITEFNTLAKAAVEGEDIGGGRMLIKCSKFGCYVDKDNKEAGLKVPEASREALVYDDKTHDQPSETPKVVEDLGKAELEIAEKTERYELRRQREENEKKTGKKGYSHPDFDEVIAASGTGSGKEQNRERVLRDRDRKRYGDSDITRKRDEELYSKYVKEGKWWSRPIKKDKDDAKDAAHMDESEAVFQHATDKENPRGVKDTIVAPEGQHPGQKQIPHESARAMKGERKKESEHDFCFNCGEIDRKENLHPCKHCGKDSNDYGWKPKKDKLIKGYSAERLRDNCPYCHNENIKHPKDVWTVLYDPKSQAIHDREHKNIKKVEDWSNADGDRHSMYNQDTDEGGMGKHKQKREVGTGYGAEQNPTGEVGWSGGGSPYPKVSKAIITNVLSRLKAMKLKVDIDDDDERDKPGKEHKTHNTETAEPDWDWDQDDKGMVIQYGIVNEDETGLGGKPLSGKELSRIAEGKKKKPSRKFKKGGEFGDMNQGETEWTEPRDTANDRRDSSLKKKTTIIKEGPPSDLGEKPEPKQSKLRGRGYQSSFGTRTEPTPEPVKEKFPKREKLIKPESLSRWQKPKQGNQPHSLSYYHNRKVQEQMKPKKEKEQAKRDEESEAAKYSAHLGRSHEYRKRQDEERKFREFEHGGHRKIEAEPEKKPDVGQSETGAEADIKPKKIHGFGGGHKDTPISEMEMRGQPGKKIGHKLGRKVGEKKISQYQGTAPLSGKGSPKKEETEDKEPKKVSQNKKQMQRRRKMPKQDLQGNPIKVKKPQKVFDEKEIMADYQKELDRFTKAEEGAGGMLMGAQRGLGHEASYTQSSGESTQVTEVKEEKEKSAYENHEQDESPDSQPNKQQIPPSKVGMDAIKTRLKLLKNKYKNIYKPLNL